MNKKKIIPKLVNRIEAMKMLQIAMLLMFLFQACASSEIDDMESGGEDQEEETNEHEDNTSEEVVIDLPIDYSWDDGIPVFFHFWKGQMLTEEEVDFVADHTDLVVLEKAHGRDDYDVFEAIQRETIALKAANPEVKVIYYWNTVLQYDFYELMEEYDNHPEWWLYDVNGEIDYKAGTTIKRYDLSNPAVRDWWISVAKDATINGFCDGIFMDAYGQVSLSSNIALWGQEKYDAINAGLELLIAETRAELGPDQLLIYNGLRSHNSTDYTQGMEFLPAHDAAMMEHFAYFNSTSKEAILRDIEAIQAAGKLGKMVLVKAWPGFSWLDETEMAESEEWKIQTAKDRIEFNLALFLLGAHEGAYFGYTWGYQWENGWGVDYEILNKSPGKPLGDFKTNNWTLSRSFENAEVTADLNAMTASIKWLND
ncbi:putative glycoside hydrolase family 15 protein [Reichenbachiella carrageenanivorans]|uniref:Glycoside hydrolase family 15 protein n=1 Tax=Reichenbachiella carrageenanivorans TaxID=2979869 RepID=A0ABY6D7M7_9BACT|nr:putative glycoside hydrolase family 15 protein [Reichenbachiella carrageenanivorans]UXX79850.1 putative glycoside hydrolase family 15 protein [Reichenbachiella carrageenanivorans]